MMSAPAKAKSSVGAKHDPLTALAIRAQTGDRAALEMLLQTIAPKLLRTVRSIVGARAPDVDDITQDSLVELVRSLPGFRGDASIDAYARRIAARAAIRARKRCRRDDSRREQLVSASRPEPAAPDDRTVERRRMGLVLALLESLPEPQAEALVMRHMLGYSLKETAAACGVPVNTVRSRVRLGREALRGRIEHDASLREALEVER